MRPTVVRTESGDDKFVIRPLMLGRPQEDTTAKNETMARRRIYSHRSGSAKHRKWVTTGLASGLVFRWPMSIRPPGDHAMAETMMKPRKKGMWRRRSTQVRERDGLQKTIDWRAV